MFLFLVFVACLVCSGFVVFVSFLSSAFLWLVWFFCFSLVFLVSLVFVGLVLSWFLVVFWFVSFFGISGFLSVLFVLFRRFSPNIFLRKFVLVRFGFF